MLALHKFGCIHPRIGGKWEQRVDVLPIKKGFYGGKSRVQPDSFVSLSVCIYESACLLPWLPSAAGANGWQTKDHSVMLPQCYYYGSEALTIYIQRRQCT